MDKCEIHQLQWKDLLLQGLHEFYHVTKECWQKHDKMSLEVPPSQMMLFCFCNRPGAWLDVYTTIDHKKKLRYLVNSIEFHVALTDKTNQPPRLRSSTLFLNLNVDPPAPPGRREKTCRPETPPWGGCFWRLLRGFLFGGLFVLPIGLMGRRSTKNDGNKPVCREKQKNNAIGSGKATDSWLKFCQFVL